MAPGSADRGNWECVLAPRADFTADTQPPPIGNADEHPRDAAPLSWVGTWHSGVDDQQAATISVSRVTGDTHTDRGGWRATGGAVGRVCGYSLAPVMWRTTEVSPLLAHMFQPDHSRDPQSGR